MWEGREPLVPDEEDTDKTKTEDEKICSCGHKLVPQGQRGFGSLPSMKCTNPNCPTKKKRTSPWGTS
jgi:hypothetical protein